MASGSFRIVDAHDERPVGRRQSDDHGSTGHDEQAEVRPDGQEGNVGEGSPGTELVPRLAVVGCAVQPVLGGRPAHVHVRRVGGEGVDAGAEDGLAHVRLGPLRVPSWRCAGRRRRQ